MLRLDVGRALLHHRPQPPGVLCAHVATANFGQCSQGVAALDERVTVPFAARARPAAWILAAKLHVPRRIALLDDTPLTAVVAHPAPTRCQANGEALVVEFVEHEGGNGLVVEIGLHINPPTFAARP